MHVKQACDACVPAVVESPHMWLGRHICRRAWLPRRGARKEGPRHCAALPNRPMPALTVWAWPGAAMRQVEASRMAANERMVVPPGECRRAVGGRGLQGNGGLIAVQRHPAKCFSGRQNLLRGAGRSPRSPSIVNFANVQPSPARAGRDRRIPTDRAVASRRFRQQQGLVGPADAVRDFGLGIEQREPE